VCVCVCVCVCVRHEGDAEGHRDAVGLHSGRRLRRWQVRVTRSLSGLFAQRLQLTVWACGPQRNCESTETRPVKVLCGRWARALEPEAGLDIVN
jgi:hypothetical protein